MLYRKLQLEKGQVATSVQEVLFSVLWAFPLVTSYGAFAPLLVILPSSFLALLIHSIVQGLVFPKR